MVEKRLGGYSEWRKRRENLIERITGAVFLIFLGKSKKGGKIMKVNTIFLFGLCGLLSETEGYKLLNGIIFS